MKKVALLVVFVLMLSVSISGCSTQDSNYKSSKNIQNDETVVETAIEDFKKQHSAIEISLDDKNNIFSAEIVDSYKGKYIYTPISYIDDVFYEDNTLYAYIEHWNDEKYILQLSSELFSKIQALNIDTVDSNLHIIYRLDDLVPLLPRISADFYFDISAPDEMQSDEYVSVSFDAKLIKGILIDVLEI